VLEIKEHFIFNSSAKLDKTSLNRALSRCNALGILDIYTVAFNQTGIVKEIFMGHVDGVKGKQTAYYAFENPLDMPERPDMKFSAWIESVETGRTLQD
jgi:hypothetical protein